MEKQESTAQIINLNNVVKTLWHERKLFYKTLPIVFVVSCIYILALPRTYSTESKLAPEMENSMGGNALGSIASSFGFNLAGMETTDAITPLLYPDLMEDNGFVAGLFNIRVKDSEGEIDATYYEYLKKYQKQPWFMLPLKWVNQLLPKSEEQGSGKFNPYYLSKEDDAIMKTIRQSIGIAVDKKTGVITISAKAQDPLVCKTIADSIQHQLQRFITNYRTNKARIDLEYYEQLTAKAKHDYEKARQLYSSYADANTEVILQSFRSKQDDLENDMQLKFNTYSVLNTQLQQAKAKVQERTPAFTAVKGAEVPIKPSGPKRMVFVLAMLILAFFACSARIMFKQSKNTP